MPFIRNKKRIDMSTEELSHLEAYMNDYENRSRDLESHATNDLEKYLWLGNAAGIAISGIYIQSAKTAIAHTLYWGVGFLLFGLIVLVLLKYLSAFISSRDRFRFQMAKMQFETGKETDAVLDINVIHDKKFRCLRRIYLVSIYGVGLLFICGCVLILFGKI